MRWRPERPSSSDHTRRMFLSGPCRPPHCKPVARTNNARDLRQVHKMWTCTDDTPDSEEGASTGQIVALADRNTLVTQDVVGGCDVEIEVRHREECDIG